jgi:hypothetical protein
LIGLDRFNRPESHWWNPSDNLVNLLTPPIETGRGQDGVQTQARSSLHFVLCQWQDMADQGHRVDVTRGLVPPAVSLTALTIPDWELGISAAQLVEA